MIFSLRKTAIKLRRTMHIHYLQHVPFEGLGSIENWAHGNGHHLTATRLYAGEQFPAFERFDCLIVMGGPMSIHDESDYVWLKGEKWFIRQAIERGKCVLGICLGAQLIADVLGARVYQGEHKEIGWFPIQKSEALASHEIATVLPDEFEVFHWHGETFELPQGAVRLASSAACLNQGFVVGERVIGLQFHLETTAASAEAIIAHCADELVQAPYIQTADQMLAEAQRFSAINTVMHRLLDYLSRQQAACG